MRVAGFFLILFCTFINICTGQEVINDDDHLRKLKRNLPSNWRMYESGKKIIIERKDSVWVYYDNKINAPYTQGDSLISEYELAKKYGQKDRGRLEFSYESKWKRSKIDRIKQENDLIFSQIEILPDIYNIRYLYDSALSRKNADVYTPTNDEERKRVKAYEDEKWELQSQFKIIPDFNTEKYSLILIYEIGMEDAYYSVYPPEASKEMYDMKELLKRILEKI